MLVAIPTTSSSLVLLGLYPQSSIKEVALIWDQPSSVQVFDRLPYEQRDRGSINHMIN